LTVEVEATNNEGLLIS